MADDRFTEVEAYLDSVLTPADADLDAAMTASAAAGLPAISVTASQGKLLQLLARSIGARRILEVGTLGGYSTIWLARAVGTEGRVVTLEVEPRHAEIARANLERAGLGDRVDIRLGLALATLPGLADLAPFDFTFIDADKANIAAYFRHAISLSRPGALIVVDNAVRRGQVIDAHSDDVNVNGVRLFLSQAAADPRVDLTVIQTVGSKGHDGFALAVVNTH